MKTLVIFSYFLLCRISLGLANLHPSEGPREPADDAPDPVKVFEAFSSLVLIADSSNDSLLDCLHAHRSELNVQAHTATYTWVLPKIGQTLPFYCKAADLGAIACTAGNDSTVLPGEYYYTDYRTCLVMGIEFQGYQCMLHATPEFKYSVPEKCIHYFEKTCGASVSLHSREHCKDDKGDRK